MSPGAGASAPAIILSSVDLPAPFFPITHHRSPRRMVRVRPSCTTRGPSHSAPPSSITRRAGAARLGAPREGPSPPPRAGRGAKVELPAPPFLRQLDLLDLVERLHA